MLRLLAHYEVAPEFVDEAYDLLRQSIISVEHDDVEMDDGEDEDMPEDDAAALRQAAADQGIVDADADGDGDSPMDEQDGEDGAATATQAEKRKVTVTYDKYIAIVNMVVQHVAEDEASGSGEGIDGDELINWYLEQKEDELENEDDFHREKALATLVLKKMVRVSN